MNIAPILAVSDALDPTAGGLIPGDVAEVHPLLVDPHRPIADHELLETFDRDLFAPQGLPTGRLVLRDHLWAVRTTDDRWWLVVDYAVPGSVATERDDAGDLVRTTYDVRLNHETSRVPDGQPGAWDAALDRAVVELGPPLPVWVIFAPPTPN